MITKAPIRLLSLAQLDLRSRHTLWDIGLDVYKRQGVFKLGNYNKISLGTEYTNDYMKNPGNLEKPEGIYTLAIYAQDEIRLWKNLQILPGFRYVYNEMFKNSFTRCV